MLNPKNDQTEIMRRESDYTPPRSLSHWFIGRPLSTADAEDQTIGKAVGLAVFASDALSSTAYATQEILVILAAAGAMAFRVRISNFNCHRRVARDRCYLICTDHQCLSRRRWRLCCGLRQPGEVSALVAAAALLTDYILTVSVSVSSGVAQIVSAYPQLFQYRVLIALLCVVFITVINLRGVKEAGAAFAIPSYFFIVIMFITVGTGLFRFFTGSLGSVVDPPAIEHFGEAVSGVTAFLLLHAFASGTTALTGVEAISNGTTAFKEPRGRNASITLVWMAFILGFLFIGISFLAKEVLAVPSESETVISQLARTVFNGQGLLYLFVILGTTIILILAANTAFAGFPRLSAMLASDGFMPRQLTYRGSRLVYSYGIVALAAVASILIVIFQASVTRLIPLYAIGVFLSFTLAQTGMTRRWWRAGHLDPTDTKTKLAHNLRYEKGLVSQDA
jgi:amino acid transporter